MSEQQQSDLIDPSKLPPPTEEMTREEAVIVGKVLYPPTVKRMTLLTRSIVEQTQTADYALWCPLAVFEDMLMTLGMATHREAAVDFLKLATVALAKLEERTIEYALECQKATAENLPWPQWRQWTDLETQECYAAINGPTTEAPAPEAATTDEHQG